MNAHPTWALIKSDATDILNFRAFIVVTVVQIASQKLNTHVHNSFIVLYNLTAQKQKSRVCELTH